MLQPMRYKQSHAGIKLKPFPQNTIRLPVFNNDGYANPALWTRENFARDRKLSSLQSQRSRVFARQHEKFPAVQNQASSTLNRVHNIGVGRHSEPLRHVHDARDQAKQLLSAPQPAGRQSTSNLPQLEYKIKNERNHHRTASKNQSSYQRSEGSPTKLLGTQVAGMSSKEQGAQPIKNIKMASGWAEVRAGHTIPNLRETPDAEKSPRDHSPGGRNTVDREVDATISTKKNVTHSDSKSNKENLAKKQSTDGDSIVTGDKPAPKKSYVSKKPGHSTNAKSKVSSGYSSMSSGSVHEEHTAPKYSVFKPSAQNDSHIDGKGREIASIYKSKVKVEENSHMFGGNDSDHQHMLTENEAKMYVHLKSAYKQTAELERERRKEQFFRKLQDVQIDTALQHNKEVQMKLTKKEQAKKRQRQQLAHIRQKFENERLKRYKSQYITKNFLNYERMDRREYGLPENYMDKTEYQAKLKRTGGTKVTALAFLKREVKLKKNYVRMFAEPTALPSANRREPKMEGRDQVTVEMFDAQGKPLKAKKVSVKSELKEAQDIINDLNMTEGASQEPESDPYDKPSPSTNKELETTTTKVSPSKTTTVKPAVAKPAVTKPTVNKPTGMKSTATAVSSTSSQASTKSSQVGNRVSSVKAKNDKLTAPTPVQTAKVQKNKPVISSKLDHKEKTTSPKEKATTSTLEQSTTKPEVSTQPKLVYGSTGVITDSKKPADTVSLDRISVITEESETGEDFYEQLMAKYGIELSDDDDDE